VPLQQEKAGGGAGGLGGTDIGLDEKAREELQAYYNLDQPIPIAYLQWLGVYPRKDRSPVALAERQKFPDFWALVDDAWVHFRNTEDDFEKSLQKSGADFRGSTMLVVVTEAPSGEEAFYQRAEELLANGLSSREALKRHLESKDWQLSGTRMLRPLSEADVQSDPELAKLAKLFAEKDQAFSDLNEILSEKSMEASRRGSYYNVEVGYSGSHPRGFWPFFYLQRGCPRSHYSKVSNFHLFRFDRIPGDMVDLHPVGDRQGGSSPGTL